MAAAFLAFNHRAAPQELGHHFSPVAGANFPAVAQYYPGPAAPIAAKNAASLPQMMGPRGFVFVPGAVAFAYDQSIPGQRPALMKGRSPAAALPSSGTAAAPLQRRNGAEEYRHEH
jgi:hypothetical protein